MNLSNASRHLTAALSCVSAAMSALHQVPIEAPLNSPSNPPSTRAEILAAHRRAHRPGMPGKIESDPELQAFILERIFVMTFPEVAAAVATHFPPGRRASKSTIHRWWKARHNPSTSNY